MRYKFEKGKERSLLRWKNFGIKCGLGTSSEGGKDGGFSRDTKKGRKTYDGKALEACCPRGGVKSNSLSVR